MSEMQTPSPWHKQFWPWFLIVVPVVTLGLSVMLITLAVSTEDSLVIDDYYKKGKAINRQLDKIQKARDLGLNGELWIEDNRVKVHFTDNTPSDGSALEMKFHHATLESKDFSLMLVQDGAGDYVGEAAVLIEGHWRLTLTPFHKQWKIQQSVALPQEAAILFTP